MFCVYFLYSQIIYVCLIGVNTVSFSNFIHKKKLGITFQMAYVSMYTFAAVYEAGLLSVFIKDLITFSLDVAKGGEMFPCTDCLGSLRMELVL